MCYEIVLTMLTYGNWYYPDEDPLAKRRKTNKMDSNKAKEQTSQTTGSNNMSLPNKPLLTVRRLVGDRLSVPKNSWKNSAQGEDVFRNVGRETNNPYRVQGYSVVDPALRFGVRDARNIWPGRVQIPNEPPRYDYGPSAIARPYPLRFRPVFNSLSGQFAHTGWVRASVSSAFTPVRHISADFQTSIVTTRPVMTEHSSAIQSLSQMVSAVRTGTSTCFTPTQITPSKSKASKPTAQPITTANPSNQSQESSRFKPSRIPVQTNMFSPSSSLRTASQTTRSVTISDVTLLPEDLSTNRAFRTARSISTESSTCQTSMVTTEPIMVSHPSSIQSPNSMVGSDTDSTSNLSPVDLSANSSRMASSETSQSEDSKPIAQLITTTPPSPIQPQESPKFKPFHIPVQTIMYSPSSLRTANQSFCSVPTTTAAVTTSLDEEHSANSAFSTVPIKSSRSPISQTSIVTTQSVMTGCSSSIQAQESPKFQPSHIPVQTIMYSPPSSLRAASRNACSATNGITTPSPEDLSTKRAFSTARSVSTGSSTCQTSIVTTQPIMTTHSSSMGGSVTNFTTTSSPIDLSVNSAYSTDLIASSELSRSEDSKPIAQPITTALPSSLQSQELSNPQSSQLPPERSTISSPPSFQPEESSESQSFIPTTQSITNSQTPKLTTHLLLLSKPQSLQSSDPSTSQTSKTTTQPNTIAPSTSLQSSESTTNKASKITTHLLLLSPPPSTQSSESSTSQTSKPTTQPTSVTPSSSLQSPESTTTQPSKRTTHLLLLSPPRSIQSSELSTSQSSKSTTQPITVASSSSTDSTTTQAPKLTTHLLLLSKPQPLQSSELSQSQNAPLTKLLLISPPISQIVSTTTTPTTTSPAVASSNIEGEGLSEVALDLEEAVVQSVVGAIKVDIPRTSQKTIKRMEDEIDEKDALLQRIYSVPTFGGKTVKGAKFYQEMLAKPKLCHLFKCMGSDCSFTCNEKTLFDQHIELHEAKQETQKETSKYPSEEDDEPYDWQQCAYCCESPIYPTTSLSEHVITEHGYCEYQCAYCFYRALFQNYVDIHQTLAHRKILKNKPRLIFKCKTFSEGPTVENALKKTGRRRCVRPYHCDQCGSEFLITEEFMNHLLKEHQSVTSYTCHICKNVCFKPDRLVVHYKLHSYSTYQCAYCLHGTETERKMIFHLCTLHFAQPACLYVRAWEDGKQIQSEDKSKKPKSRSKSTNQLDSLKMISYDIEAPRGESTLEEASDEDSVDGDRLVIDESQELNDIIAELGITTETESNEATTPFLIEPASIGNSAAQNVSLSTLLPNAKFSLEAETESEIVLISSGSSSN